MSLNLNLRFGLIPGLLSLVVISGCGFFAPPDVVTICEDPEVFLYLNSVVRYSEDAGEALTELSSLAEELNSDQSLFESSSWRNQIETLLQSGEKAALSVSSLSSPRKEFEAFNESFNLLMDEYKRRIEDLKHSLADGDTSEAAIDLASITSIQPDLAALMEQLDLIIASCL